MNEILVLKKDNKKIVDQNDNVKKISKCLRWGPVICSYFTLLIIIALLIVIKLITIGKSGIDPETFP